MITVRDYLKVWKINLIEVTPEESAAAKACLDEVRKKRQERHAKKTAALLVLAFVNSISSIYKQILNILYHAVIYCNQYIIYLTKRDNSCYKQHQLNKHNYIPIFIENYIFSHIGRITINKLK